MTLTSSFAFVLTAESLSRVRAVDRLSVLSVGQVFGSAVDFLFLRSDTNRHELVITILYRKFVCLNTKVLAFIDLGSKTYIGL